MVSKPHAVLIGGSDELLEQCTRALDGLCSVGHGPQSHMVSDEMPEFGAPPASSAPIRADLVLVCYSRIVQYGVSHLLGLRVACGHKPLALLVPETEYTTSQKLVGDQAKAIVKIPVPSQQLRATTAELLGVVNEASGEHFTVNASGRLDPGERRRSLRVQIPAEHELQTAVSHQDATWNVRVVNLSLQLHSTSPSGMQGGVLLAATPETFTVSPPPFLKVGDRVQLSMQLPERSVLVQGAARVITAINAESGHPMSLALQFDVTDPQSASALSGYWVKLQLEDH